MGSQMAVHDRGTDVDPEAQDSVGLPNELLVKIISLLPEARDRVKLLYVSQRIRSITSETPSLWRDFMWPDCNPRETQCLHSVMKACGVHIRRLAFPQHLIQPILLPSVGQATLSLVKMSEMTKMLQYCMNLTHLDLPNLSLAGEELDEHLKVIEELKNLEVLSVHIRSNDLFQSYLGLKITLKELTIHTVIHAVKNIGAFRNWMMNGFIPPNLNIVVHKGGMHMPLPWIREVLGHAWPIWNSHVPAGHVACLRLYSSYKVPLNLFKAAPVFQLQFGKGVTYPVVKPTSVGVTAKWLLFINHKDGGKTVHMASVCPPPSLTECDIIHNHDCSVSKLACLTELNLRASYFDITQLVSACPQLQRLNLQGTSLRVQYLQVIASSCHSLKGLNLMEIRPRDISFYLKAWEILSGMKLTHLSVDDTFFGSSSPITDAQKKQLIASFKQCTTLKALELYIDEYEYPDTRNTDYFLLAHFPSLEYCRVYNSQRSTCMQDVLNTCNNLRYFYCKCQYLSQQIVHNCNINLQQLYISSHYTSLDDEFMEAVSVHGGLVHVGLFVFSVVTNGVTSLIKNSPNLLTFGLQGQREDNLESLGETLGKKFASRRLFTSGLVYLILQKENSEFEDTEQEFDEWLQNTDLVSLWPSDEMNDFR